MYFYIDKTLKIMYNIITTTEVKKMIKVTGLNEWAQIIEEEEFYRKIEKKAKKEIRKQRIAELMAEGIDKTIAEVMADCGL